MDSKIKLALRIHWKDSALERKKIINEMSSSLEELLAEDGFKGKRSAPRSRSSFRSEAASRPPYPSRDQTNRDSSFTNRVKAERTRSDVSRYMLRHELARSDSSMSRRPRDNLPKIEKIVRQSKKENRERLERKGSLDLQKGRKEDVSREDFRGNEIVEIGAGEFESFKDIYSNEVRSLKKKYSSSSGSLKEEKYRTRSAKDMTVDKRPNNSSSKHLAGLAGLTDKHRKSFQHPETSYGGSSRGSQNNKSFEDNQTQNRYDLVPTVSQPALDEAAVQAMVSILNGYIKRFLKNEDFRTTLRHNCFSCLNFIELEDQKTESKVIANLENAIETIERATEEPASSKELKKASLQLSVITGLNSNDLKDGFTSGIPDSKLSACAHLYLSVVYKLQKKDTVSAKHLLQVFCDSPTHARMNLLPDLWEYLFCPHLSHLKEWYIQEAESLVGTPSRARKLKLLEKVYNEILDSGTYQFAVYYKDWLTEGVEAPSVPSIHIPSVSIGGHQHGGSLADASELPSPGGPLSPQPMVSKKLYDAVFRQSHNSGFPEAGDDMALDSFDNCVRSSDGSGVDLKQTLSYSCEAVKYSYQDTEEAFSKNERDDAFLYGLSALKEDGASSTAEEEWRSPGVNLSPKKDNHDKDDIYKASNILEISTGGAHVPNTNELTLRRLAKSVFEIKKTENSVNLTISSLPHLNEPTKIRPHSFEELNESYANVDEELLFSCIPEDFTCPLTGKLFEDPVTLETGQTFERMAIKEWFDQGNRTCPVTGKTLEYLSLPLTNFILKRIIDRWKSENCRYLLAFVSQVVGISGGHGFTKQDETTLFILEQLLTAFSREERLMNAKQLIALGSLEFLIQRFEQGNLEEKTRVGALLFCCIKADAGCRNQIARKINIKCLLGLLHSKQIKSRTNAVLLLTELICMSRRRDVPTLLSGLHKEEIVNTMDALLVYLQSSQPERRPLVAALLLHLDLLVEPQKNSIYREEAIDAMTVALDSCLTNEDIQESCCRALLFLGGCFSSSGKLLTGCWILKQVGFNDACEVNYFDKEENNLVVDDTIPLEEEEEEEEEEDAAEEWLRNMSISLLATGKKSFLETISKCLASGNLDLVKVCLITVTWLSCALSSLPDAEFQISAFSILIAPLKDCLEHNESAELKTLASLSLLNFSKTSECRIMLIKMAEEIAVPLQSLFDITWTAKQLHQIVSGEDL